MEPELKTLTEADVILREVEKHKVKNIAKAANVHERHMLRMIKGERDMPDRIKRKVYEYLGMEHHLKMV